MNNTSIHDHLHDVVLTTGAKLYIIVLCLMVVASLLGNTMVITAISRTKSLRTLSNLLVINLSICDALTSLFGITLTLIIYNMYYKFSFPYGELGCKLLWPAATYTGNCSAFTLATIAIERYYQISSRDPNRNATGSKKKLIFLFTTIHVLAVISVLPYISALKYKIYEKHAYCFEYWKAEWHMQAYTVSLFLVQYMCPVVTMAVFYLLSWRTLHKHIKALKEFQHGLLPLPEGNNEIETESGPNVHLTTLMSSSNRSVIEDGGSLLGTVTRTENKGVIKQSISTQLLVKHLPWDGEHSIRKCSQVLRTKRKKAINILKMFTVISTVFACCALPHQLHWIFQAFAHLTPMIASNVFIMLTYVNPVINSWIYAGFNDSIRKAYLQRLCCK